MALGDCGGDGRRFAHRHLRRLHPLCDVRRRVAARASDVRVRAGDSALSPAGLRAHGPAHRRTSSRVRGTLLDAGRTVRVRSEQGRLFRRAVRQGGRTRRAGPRLGRPRARFLGEGRAPPARRLRGARPDARRRHRGLAAAGRTSLRPRRRAVGGHRQSLRERHRREARRRRRPLRHGHQDRSKGKRRFRRSPFVFDFTFLHPHLPQDVPRLERGDRRGDAERRLRDDRRPERARMALSRERGSGCHALLPYARLDDAEVRPLPREGDVSRLHRTAAARRLQRRRRRDQGDRGFAREL